MRIGYEKATWGFWRQITEGILHVASCTLELGGGLWEKDRNIKLSKHQCWVMCRCLCNTLWCTDRLLQRENKFWTINALSYFYDILKTQNHSIHIFSCPFYPTKPWTWHVTQNETICHRIQSNVTAGKYPTLVNVSKRGPWRQKCWWNRSGVLINI